ncbi:MAG: sigma-70 family RNA polymerase sigma factor [Phycisphaerales bacterium]|nr:sigma-70 family RNA polymerase sigma factor [Phycisphaerales bacterium]MCB9864285.1 sigma-70 family RNA polymerase sigma factor [Phycisphaerales bacterium]
MCCGRNPVSDSKVDNVTKLLGEIRDGDRSALERLFPIVYQELKALAAHISRNPRHTLQPTALVHEAYVRLVRQDGSWNDRKHFFHVAAKAIRQVLVDHARRRDASKRGGGGERITFSESLDSGRGDLNLVEFEDALKVLESRDERQARIVEMRFIVGLTIEETADVLGVSPRTVNVDWQMARAWLRRELSASNES